MTEKYDIYQAVNFLKKEETQPNVKTSNRLIYVVITSCFKFCWPTFSYLLTLLNQLQITFKNYTRLSVRFLTQNILNMMEFSYVNLLRKDTKVKQSFYQGFSYISLIITLILPNY